MDGELRGYGVKGGGTLSIDSGIGVAIGGGVLADNGILPAGQSVPVHLTLAEAFTIKAGTVLDSDFNYVSEHLAPGQVLLDLPDFTVSRPYTLAAAWVVPPASVSWESIYIGATNGYNLHVRHDRAGRRHAEQRARQARLRLPGAGRGVPERHAGRRL